MWESLEWIPMVCRDKKLNTCTNVWQHFQGLHVKTTKTELMTVPTKAAKLSYLYWLYDFNCSSIKHVIRTLFQPVNNIWCNMRQPFSSRCSRHAREWYPHWRSGKEPVKICPFEIQHHHTLDDFRRSSWTLVN